jgi:hypothetical protein
MQKIFLFLTFFATAAYASRYYCYKGSSLYQVEYVDCGDLNGISDWYCSKVTVCENDIDSERECIETRYLHPTSSPIIFKWQYSLIF